MWCPNDLIGMVQISEALQDVGPFLCYNEPQMNKSENLVEIINSRLPSGLVDFLRLAGLSASRLEQKIYLVGGVVRDLLLARNNTDLDLVVEGDAIIMAQELAKIRGAKVVAQSLFKTAKIKWERWVIDIATARIESYSKPGQLPKLEGSADILKDLQRRDFSINSMAVRLEPQCFGELIDIFDGRNDLAAGLIRVLHEKSFQDDATRIWRAVRYEQRLDFEIETKTRSLIDRDISYLDTLSADRLRNELELCLEEEKPEKVLLRAAEIGIFQRLVPSWQISPQTIQCIKKARGVMQPYSPPQETYLAILASGLKQPDLEALIKRLNLGRSVSSTLRDSMALQETLPALAEVNLSNGQIFRLLKNMNPNALLANRVMLDSGLIKERLDLYLNQLRRVKTGLNGDDLIQAGYPSGPVIGEILEKLKEARLEGRVASTEDELDWLKQIGQPRA
jgi:tRNA nucleotidyltransferase (CCA-adding enzyme)